MSKVNKMRDRIAHMADKSREEFEQKKKELEEEMNKGRTNYSKIQRGLKNNEVINDPTLAVELGETTLLPK
jgi:predicted DNA-binding ArsR family transcriptional regulator